MAERAPEARRVAGREQLLGVGRAVDARTAELLNRLADVPDEQTRHDLVDELVVVNLGVAHSIAVRYRPATLLRMAPWLARYWWNSAPDRLERQGRAILPLIERCIDEHRRWTAAAGTGRTGSGSGVRVGGGGVASSPPA